MIRPGRPALILAPMDGITDAPMRALQGEIGAFTHSVSEFVRVSQEALPAKVFRREVPELANDGFTPTGLAVQVQILGGDPGRMAQTALIAVKVGASAIDINFGCPAPTVNRNDGGATLLKYPDRIRDIVSAVRAAVPLEIPVSAKLRLGWDDIESIHRNARMAAEGGASWLTIHARTRIQGYAPPVFWEPIGTVRRSLDIPVVANGDIWSREDFLRCREVTGCEHFMIGRGALADPQLSHTVAQELGLPPRPSDDLGWERVLRGLLFWCDHYRGSVSPRSLLRLKQWMNLAHRHADFPHFPVLKHAETVEQFFDQLRELQQPVAVQI